jgi:hypothetical protein
MLFDHFCMVGSGSHARGGLFKVVAMEKKVSIPFLTTTTHAPVCL